MKIGFLRTDDLTGLERQEGGSYSHIGGFVRALRQLGHEVFFIASGVPSDIRDGSVPLHLVGYPDFFRGIPDVSPLAYNFRLVPQALPLLRRERPDLLYQRHSAFNVSGVSLARLTGVPLILEFNGSEVWIQSNWSHLYLRHLCRLSEQVAVTGADGVVAISEVARSELLKMSVEATRIIVNPNGVDPEQFHPQVDGAAARLRYGLSDKVVVGFLATFGVWHGAMILADSIRLVVDRNPRVHFLLMGDGHLRPDVERKIDADGVRRAVTLTGLVPHHEVPRHLAACDVLVSPHTPFADGSAFFGSPTKLFEYMAMGRGIVASRLGQIAETLSHGRNAWLVEPGNRADLVEGILQLTEDRELRERLGTQARRDVVSKYTWQRNAERVIDLYRHLRATR